MRITPMFLTASAALALAAMPALAQMTIPGAPEISRVAAGTYTVDAAHTQVVWTVNHLGFSLFQGMFGGTTGTLTLDPTKPDAGSVTITIPIENVMTTSAALNTHLKSADFFDVAKFPTATFTSTAIKASGGKATITGNLTLHGVTKPVVLDATFIGAGTNSMSKKLNVGFDATTTIKRSDFGINYGLPAISDDVKLHIAAAFAIAA